MQTNLSDVEGRVRRYWYTDGLGELIGGGMAIVLAFTISALAMAFVLSFESFDSIVAVTGFIVGMILLLLRAKSGLNRFYILGAVSIVLGFLLSMSALSNGYSLGLFYGLMGLCFVVSGGLTLRHYLAQNPLPAEGQNG